MKYIEARPNSILSNYVKCFWYLEKEYPTTNPADETILPDGCLDFVFQINENKLLAESKEGLLQQSFSFLIGQQKDPIRLTTKGTSITAGIRFLAYGAYPFLQFPVNKLNEPTIRLADLLGRGIIELSEKVQGLSVQKIFKEFEKFLIGHLPSFSRDIEPVKIATDILFQDVGSTDISKLALEVNLSTRNLERKFDEVVGLSPKSFARVIRFDQIKNELILNPQTSLTTLSFRYGYFDQAHFIHDFKKFTGKSPSVFKQEALNQPIYFYK